LNILKTLPNVKLVKITVDDDAKYGCLRQKINIIIKNNGDTSAFLLEGFLIVEDRATIINCNYKYARFSLSQADWTYDVNIDDDKPRFAGRHVIAPNEVVNFNIMVARKRGGHELTIYKAFVQLVFDEGDTLKTSSFHLRISGPTVWEGMYVPHGPSPEEWGRCMADNIRRLDEVGYDFRPNIQAESRKYIEAVAPGLLSKSL
jgi:hypothetical protein